MKRMCGYSRVIANAFQRKWKFCVAFLCATILLETMLIAFGGYGDSTDEDRPEHFLSQYEAYCARSLLPRGWYVMPGPSSEIVPIYGNPNNSAKFMWWPLPHRNLSDTDSGGDLPQGVAVVSGYDHGSSTQRMPSNDYGLCSCVPSELEGRHNITFAMPYIGELEMRHPELAPGGAWRPTDCIPRQKVALIVPFRDREEHLRIFLNLLIPMLQRQKLSYRIIVIEQARPDVFNKAMMMNIGFKEANKLDEFDCFIFHDVDMLPEDDRNIYSCSAMPRHVGAYCDKWDYKVPYQDIFGGATAFTGQHFRLVNGFSNQYYGWGGEDDDIFKRVRAANLKVVRYPSSVARYTMVKHKADRRNPYNKNSGMAWGYRPEHYAREGLTTLDYHRLNIEFRPLYTWIYAEVAPPKDFNRPQKSGGAVWCSQRCAPHVWCALLLLCLLSLHDSVR